MLYSTRTYNSRAYWLTVIWGKGTVEECQYWMWDGHITGRVRFLTLRSKMEILIWGKANQSKKALIVRGRYDSPWFCLFDIGFCTWSLELCKLLLFASIEYPFQLRNRHRKRPASSCAFKWSVQSTDSLLFCGWRTLGCKVYTLTPQVCCNIGVPLTPASIPSLPIFPSPSQSLLRFSLKQIIWTGYPASGSTLREPEPWLKFRFPQANSIAGSHGHRPHPWTYRLLFFIVLYYFIF